MQWLMWVDKWMSRFFIALGVCGLFVFGCCEAFGAEPPQFPEPPQAPPARLTYPELVARVESAGRPVYAACGVPARFGFTPADPIKGWPAGLYECFLQDGRPKMRRLEVRPVKLTDGVRVWEEELPVRPGDGEVYRRPADGEEVFNLPQTAGWYTFPKTGRVYMTPDGPAAAPGVAAPHPFALSPLPSRWGEGPRTTPGTTAPAAAGPSSSSRGGSPAATPTPVYAAGRRGGTDDDCPT